MTPYYINCGQNVPNSVGYLGYYENSEIEYIPPIFFSNFMKKRIYCSNHILVYDKSNVVMSSSKFNLRSDQDVNLFFQKEDSSDYIREFFDDKNIYDVDASQLDSLKGKWVYRIRKQWYVVGTAKTEPRPLYPPR